MKMTKNCFIFSIIVFSWCNGYHRRNGHGDTSSNPRRECISCSSNTLMDGINTIILTPAMGKSLAMTTGVREGKIHRKTCKSLLETHCSRGGCIYIYRERQTDRNGEWEKDWVKGRMKEKLGPK